MKKTLKPLGMIVLMLAVALAPGCSDDPATDPGTPEPGNLPAIPVPGSVDELLPERSDDLVVGLSNPIEIFEPLVTELQMMTDDGSQPWSVMNRRLILACPNALPEYSCDPSLADRAIISAPPRLLHSRYWYKIKQVTLAPGTTYSREEVIGSGASTTHEESRDFSQTMGVSVTAEGGWGPFSASVTASYEQTSSVGELNSVTFDEYSETTETYAVEADPVHTRVYTLWQLVDKFSLVDADTVRIGSSATMSHAQIADTADIEFPNGSVVRQMVTSF